MDSVSIRCPLSKIESTLKRDWESSLEELRERDAPENGTMDIQFIGHCTFLMETGAGVRLLTDPWFARRGLLRKISPALGADEINEVDYVLVSHNHLDHCDNSGLALARRCDALVVGSERVVRRARRSGCDRVAGLRPGGQFADESVRITATHTDHPLSWLFGDSRPIGFFIEIDGMRLYFSGDTRVHPALLEQLHPFDRIDVAFLQIAAGRYHVKDGMCISTAASLARRIRPWVTIPMHYHSRFRDADPQELVQALAPDGLEVRAFEVGERRSIEGGSS